MIWGGGGIGGPGGFVRTPIAGGPGSHGGLTRGADLTDETVFGKVYDRKIVSRIARYLQNYKVGVAVAFTSMIIATLTMLFMPLLFSDGINIIETGDPQKLDIIVRYLIQSFNVQGTTHILTAIFIIFVINGLLALSSQYVQQYSMANVGRGILLTLRMQMFEHLEKLSLAFYDRNEVGRIMSRVQNDVASGNSQQRCSPCFCQPDKPCWHHHYHNVYEC
jgi:ATP-binding cassette subfamily B protein